MNMGLVAQGWCKCVVLVTNAETDRECVGDNGTPMEVVVRLARDSETVWADITVSGVGCGDDVNGKP